MAKASDGFAVHAMEDVILDRLQTREHMLFTVTAAESLSMAVALQLAGELRFETAAGDIAGFRGLDAIIRPLLVEDAGHIFNDVQQRADSIVAKLMELFVIDFIDEETVSHARGG